jgi:hypothetical protein
MISVRPSAIRVLYACGAVLMLAFVFWLGARFGLHLADMEGPRWIPPEAFNRYELYTWRNRSRDVCFALMPEYQSGRFIHGWTAKWRAKCGVAQMKEAVASLPAGTVVSWTTWPAKGCDYPDQKIVAEVIEFAKARRVEVKLLPSLTRVKKGTDQRVYGVASQKGVSPHY